MKENREFTMLEHADDMTVELLAEVPALTKEEKERIRAMGKRKLENMRRENISVENSGDDRVEGVERYSRPKTRIVAAIAACFVLAGGLTGTLFALGKFDKKGDNKLAAPTTSASEEATQPASSIIGEGDEEIPYYSDEELSEITKEKLEKLFNIADIVRDPTGLVSVDKSKVLDSVTEYDGTEHPYYKVTDERFANIDDATAYLTDNLAGALLDEYKGMFFGNDPAPPMFKEVNGELCVADLGINTPEYKLNGEPTISNYDGTKLDFSVPVILSERTCIMNGNAVYADGSWKICEYKTVDPLDLNADRGGEEPGEALAIRLAADLGRVVALANGGGVRFDYDSVREVQIDGWGTANYYKVIKDKFSPNIAYFESVAEVKDYVESVCAEDLIEKQFLHIYDAVAPRFMELDGELYYLPEFKAGYSISSDSAEIIEATDDYLVFNTKWTLPGESGGATVYAGKDNGVWKLKNFELNSPTNSGSGENDPALAERYHKSVKDILNNVAFIEGMRFAECFKVSPDDYKDVDNGSETYRYYRVDFKRDETTFRNNEGGEFALPPVEDPLDEGFITKFLETVSCDGYYSSQHDDFFYGDSSMYKEFDGALYFCPQLSLRSKYDFTDSYSIENATETSFTITVQRMGENSLPMYVSVKNVDGLFKISSVFFS